MDRYDTVYRGGTGEYIEKKSRFIAEVYPVVSEDEAFAHLEEVKKRYWDARHHCWAYVIGRNPASERMSDDGEPAGTAGKPILEVIRGRNVTDVFVVVTRYFGGTLLGTGGLVRAYTAATAAALSDTVIIARRDLYILDTDYTDKVVISLLVPEEEEGAFTKEVLEGTNGQAVMEKKGKCWFARTENGVEVWEL